MSPSIQINTPRVGVSIPHGSGGKEEVFWATYGTTTNAEIEAAYQAGKVVLVNRQGFVHLLTYRGSATSHYFSTFIDQYEYLVKCKNNSWTYLQSQYVISAGPTIISPTFTGTPTAPTAAPGTDTTQLATTEFVQQEIAGVFAGGLSQSLKAALLQIAQKVAYIDADGSTYYQDLYDALYASLTTYTVSNFLTDVVNSNSSATIEEGSTYTATLSCAQNYEITSVTITMGGNDVTGTSYSGGSITIANVTGNIVITAVATERTATLLSIDAVFTQGSATIYDTDSLDTLKQYLVVTAHWSDNTTSTVASSDYTLSGTLTAGTSTITVSYGGKTDTFTVTVSLGLDSIAFSTYTYRDIFITNNLCSIGNFEGTYTMDSQFHSVGNNCFYKMLYGGNPTISAEYSVSPTHSLKCFSTSAVRAFFKQDSQSLASGVTFLVAANVKTNRYTSGNVGVVFNSPINGAVDRASAICNEVTTGFEPKAAIATLTANRADWCVYIGVNGTGNADCYVDDVVVSIVPDTMTSEDAQTLYENYTAMILGGAT